VSRQATIGVLKRRVETDIGGAADEGTADFGVVAVVSGRAALVAVRGDLDLSTAPALARELDGVRRADSVLIDLERVGFIDLSGLHPLVEFALTAGRAPVVSITAGSPSVQTLLKLSGLAEHFTVVPRS
jgi:anti-sigma B factor antagonist